MKKTFVAIIFLGFIFLFNGCQKDITPYQGMKQYDEIIVCKKAFLTEKFTTKSEKYNTNITFGFSNETGRMFAKFKDGTQYYFDYHESRPFYGGTARIYLGASSDSASGATISNTKHGILIGLSYYNGHVMYSDCSVQK